MQIGGTDRWINCKLDINSQLFIFWKIKQLWPKMIIRARFDEDKIDPENSWIEFFLYKNKKAKKAWSKDGGTEENQPTLINVIANSKAITFVFDSSQKDINEAMDQIMTELKKMSNFTERNKKG